MRSTNRTSHCCDLLGTMHYVSFLLYIASLSRSVTAQAVASTSENEVFASHTNSWAALSEDEVAGVNDLIQRKFNLSGYQGSR